MILQRGSAVKITNSKYDELPGTVYGVIAEINPKWKPASVKVKVAGFDNSKSKTNDFYFEADDISEIDMDIPSMYPSTIFYDNDRTGPVYRDVIQKGIARIENYYKKKETQTMELIKGYTTVIVTSGTNSYAVASYEEGICVGDTVLFTDYGNQELKGEVAKVFDVNDDVPTIKHAREIICKLNYSAYFDRVERKKKIAKLKSAMAKKKEELNELAVYQALAATSPEMADMLKELKELL